MKAKIFLILVSFFCLPCFSQQKRLYIGNDDHTDYMWTANEAKYDSAFVHMLDYYLHQVDSTKNHPSDFQARFNTDGSIWLKAYEKYRSQEQFNKLIAAIKSGHISSPLNMLVSCYGAQPTEAVIRGMYYAGQLERKYKLRFTLAGSMENNTLPLGLASLWAGSGARYSWKGIGGYGSQMSYAMRAKRKYSMYRYNGLDGSGVLMKWYPYNEKTIPPLGGYAECRMVIKYKSLDKEIGEVINVLDSFSGGNKDYQYSYKIAAAFGFGHDDLQTLISNPFINAARNATNAKRKVRVSNEEDFFKDFETTYPKLPSQSVSYGNEWDLLSASMNETTAKVRRATEKLRTAEALASIVSLKDKNFANDLIKMRNDAWESFGVYWEHNWTADGPVSRQTRAEWQIKRQEILNTYVDTLYQRSLALLGSQIRKTSRPSFLVFNPLNWMRNDVADLLYNGPYPVQVIDIATQKEVASQLVVKDNKKFLRIMAENIPPVGYRVFEIRNNASAITEIAASVKGEYFVNSFYRLRLNKSGAITELYDSVNNSRQLIKMIDGKYANDLGGVLNEGEELALENAGPVSVTIKAVSRNPVLHTVRFTLFNKISRIEIEDSIQENFGDVKTWAFSFDLKNQITRHEELGAILTVKKESNGGHYADENARYDYQTFNHFANLSEMNYGVTLSNMDCSFFKLGNSTVDSLWETSSQINALAGGNIDKKVEDGGVLGIYNQNGQKDFLYKFAIITHRSAFNPATSMKFSLEHQNPLVTALITGAASSSASNSFSLLNISDPDLILWSVKPSEEGIEKGLITRIWNMGTRASNTNIKVKPGIEKAWKTTHIETDQTMLKPVGQVLKINVRPNQINTYRIITAVR